MQQKLFKKKENCKACAEGKSSQEQNSNSYAAKTSKLLLKRQTEFVEEGEGYSLRVVNGLWGQKPSKAEFSSVAKSVVSID